MEQVVRRWRNNRELAVELMAYDDHESREVRQFAREITEGEESRHTTAFKLVETNTGREVEFPIQLIADTRFRKPDDR